MERIELDQVAAKRHVQDVQAGLRALDVVAASGGADVPRGVVRGAVAAAMTGLDDVVRLFTTSASATAEPARVPCPRCGRMVMSNATLCGFCWRTLSPVAAG